MRTLTKTILFIAALSVHVGALAETPMSKTSTPIDFNKMIEDNNVERSHLVRHTAPPASKAEKLPAQNKVIDFIDVEVGVGETPSVVDRRFDSVGEARIYSAADANAEVATLNK